MSLYFVSSDEKYLKKYLEELKDVAHLAVFPDTHVYMACKCYSDLESITGEPKFREMTTEERVKFLTKEFPLVSLRDIVNANYDFECCLRMLGVNSDTEKVINE